MTAHAFADRRPRPACPFMPVFGPPQVMFVRGQRHRAVGQRRQALPRLPRRPRRDRRSATPTRSSPRRSPTRPASCCTSATCSPTRSPRRRRSRSTACSPRPPASDGQVFFTNSGRRGQRVRDQAGPQARRPRPPRRRQRPRQLPRAHAGRARGDRPADQARAVPADARGLPPRRVGRPRRRSPRPSTPSVAAVLIEPVQGEGGVNAAPPTATSAAIRELCDETRRADDGRRDPDRLRPHRARGSASSTTASCPTSSRWPRRWATACRSARAGPAATSPRCSSPATTAARTAARRSPPPRSAR